jgi:cardiolipin synthase
MCSCSFSSSTDDGLGRRLKDALIAKARAGVRCYVLYDEVGSHDLPAAYVTELRAAGVDIRPFNTRQGDANRFQLNFRNHRKIVIVDGRTAFVGGHNVGDEYLGKDPGIGPWRDTTRRCRARSCSACRSRGSRIGIGPPATAPH